MWLFDIIAILVLGAIAFLIACLFADTEKSTIIEEDDDYFD